MLISCYAIQEFNLFVGSERTQSLLSGGLRPPVSISWLVERTKLGGGLTGEMVTERPTNREQSDYSHQARHTTMHYQ